MAVTAKPRFFQQIILGRVEHLGIAFPQPARVYEDLDSPRPMRLAHPNVPHLNVHHTNDVCITNEMGQA